MRSLMTKIVDQLLGLDFGQKAGGEVALDVDVEEGRDAPDRHRRAVLFLDRGEVAEVESPAPPLARWWPGRRCRSRTSRPFRAARRVRGTARTSPRAGAAMSSSNTASSSSWNSASLGFYQPVDAVERDAAVVADDPAAAVGVGQAGDDGGLAGRENVGRVGIEHALVVGLAVLGADLGHGRVRLEPVGLEPAFDHPQAAVRHDRALERRIGLQTDDQLVVAVDVAGVMRGDRGGAVGGDVEHAFCAFELQKLCDVVPQFRGARGRTGEECGVTFPGRVVFLDETTNVDAVAPDASRKSVPRVRDGGVFRGVGEGIH